MEHHLSKEEISRFSRQLLLPEIGVDGQSKLKSCKVLVIGAGGLGCPVSIYLAAAGIGVLGVVDFDVVEISNLHRQILHTESGAGLTSKAQSICDAANRINCAVQCRPFQLQLNSENALQIVEQFDIVADCTDNVSTRYLLNDACVLAKKPLVSGSALRWEGQLTVYDTANKGPCYRCIFPQPPPPETVTNCSEGGVMGPVPGLIGCLQALEILKLAAGLKSSYVQRMLMFEGLEGQMRTIKLRNRNENCAVCGDSPSITKLIDYDLFCGSGACDKAKPVEKLDVVDRISVQQYSSVMKSGERHVLVDTRPTHEFQICKLPNAVNIPMDSIANCSGSQLSGMLVEETVEDGPISDIFIVCHRGNDSQDAVLQLRDKLTKEHCAALCDDFSIRDIRGGLELWAREIDHNFPTY